MPQPEIDRARPGEPTTEPTSPRFQIDVHTPNACRIDTRLLGGLDYYRSDSALVNDLLDLAPDAPDAAHHSFAAAMRALRHCVGTAGIAQVLDLGTGRLHPVAGRDPFLRATRGMRRSTRIIYVEHDPAAAAYARIAHDIDDRTAVCEADFADLDTVFASGAVQLLDQDRPVVATLTRTLHRLPPNTDHAAYLADLVRRLPSGSYVVVCHFTCADPSLGRQINALMSTATNGTWGHVATPGCMREWFKGLQLIDDRLERADQAWTDTPPATLSAPALTGHSAVVWVP